MTGTVKRPKGNLVSSYFMTCRFCGYRGNFPDSGECPHCGETN